MLIFLLISFKSAYQNVTKNRKNSNSDFLTSVLQICLLKCNKIFRIFLTLIFLLLSFKTSYQNVTENRKNSDYLASILQICLLKCNKKFTIFPTLIFLFLFFKFAYQNVTENRKILISIFLNFTKICLLKCNKKVQIMYFQLDFPAPLQICFTKMYHRTEKILILIFLPLFLKSASRNVTKDSEYLEFLVRLGQIDRLFSKAFIVEWLG